MHRPEEEAPSGCPRARSRGGRRRSATRRPRRPSAAQRLSSVVVAPAKSGIPNKTLAVVLPWICAAWPTVWSTPSRPPGPPTQPVLPTSVPPGAQLAWPTSARPSHSWRCPHRPDRHRHRPHRRRYYGGACISNLVTPPSATRRHRPGSPLWSRRCPPGRGPGARPGGHRRPRRGPRPVATGRGWQRPGWRCRRRRSRGAAAPVGPMSVPVGPMSAAPADPVGPMSAAPADPGAPMSGAPAVSGVRGGLDGVLQTVGRALHPSRPM